MDRIRRIFGIKEREGVPNEGPDEEYVRLLAGAAMSTHENQSEVQPNKLTGSMGEAEDLIRDNTLTIDQKRLAAKELREEIAERLRRESIRPGTYSSELNYYNHEEAIAMLDIFLGVSKVRENNHWIQEYMLGGDEA